MRVFVASFFLFIFSIQIIPVQEIGKTLFDNTLTDEIHECNCNDCDRQNALYLKDNNTFSFSKNFCHNGKLALSSSLAYTNTQSLSKQYLPDIPTPPPNC